MFQNQNQNQNSTTNAPTDKNSRNTEFVSHTMKKDLAEISNPTAAKTNTDDFLKNIYIPPKNLTDQQKSSPFLNPTPPSAPRPISTPSPATPWRTPEPIKVMPQAKTPPVAPVEKKSAPIEALENPIEMGTNVYLGKPAVRAFITIILLSIVGGLIYFWQTRQTEPVVVVPPVPEEIVEEPVKPDTPPAIQYSTDKPNYLNIDIENADELKIQEAIKNTAANILTSNITTPIEFVVSDLQNNPVSLTNFATKFELDFSQAILLNSAATFSIFLYNDQGVVHLALAIDSKNESALRAAMDKDELLLETKLASLFLDTTYTSSQSAFASSSYAKAAIRYKNIVSSNELSLDYTIFNQKLLIGTTKMTLRSIIDYLSAKADSPTNEVVAPNSSTTAPELAQ